VRCLAAALGCTALAAWGAAAPAQANVSLLVHTGYVNTNWVGEDQPFTIRIDFSKRPNDPSELELKVKPQAAGECAATPVADTGRLLLEESVSDYGAREVTAIEDEPTNMLACAWLSDRERPTGYEPPTSLAFRVVPMAAEFELSLVPGTVVLRGMPVGVDGRLSSGPGRRLSMGFGPAPPSGDCAQRSDASLLAPVIPGGLELTDESAGFVRFVRPPRPGLYLVCAWIEEPDDAKPEAASRLRLRVTDRRTRTETTMIAFGARRHGRRDVWVSVAARAMPLPVEHGDLRLTSWRRGRWRAAHPPIDLARTRRYDICVDGNPQRDVLRVVARAPAGVSLSARYRPTADFTASASPIWEPVTDRRIHGYDRVRDRCVLKPVVSPVR
jgi:hypothetical protein